MSDDLPIPTQRQTAAAVLMIRPARFASNTETLASNSFQTACPDGTAAEAAAAARREFDALATNLARKGVRVHAFAGQTKVHAPDEVFPNNWISTHADGTAVLYPLLAENRRRERRRELLDALRETHGYRLERIIDLSHLERDGKYLEGTGSLVLDRRERVAYACFSPRTHPDALAVFARELDYEIVAFDAADRSGRAIYHTNVLMSLGTGFAAICANAIPDAATRRRILDRLAANREVIDLGIGQLHAFAGNLLALAGSNGEIVALSASALASLDPRQVHALERHAELAIANIDTIERYGGGSVRCMLAEVHLPLR